MISYIITFKQNITFKASFKNNTVKFTAFLRL